MPSTSSSNLTLGLCPRCGGPVHVRTRHLQIEGSAVRVFCSQRCATEPAVALEPPPPPPPSPWRHVLRAAVAIPMLAFTSGYSPLHSAASVATTAPSALPGAMIVQPPAAPPEPPAFGPSWPPTEKDWLAEITADAWLHPLDGPARRMPIRDGRVFGAERPGDRPAECRNGHCGIDIGGEVWGEPVHAAHDGVVERVQRGPNEDHGGLYVRIGHRGGTIFTQYFHLAAIPRWIQPGVKVKMGDLIGLLGDSGVKHSTAHLHFTVSVKPASDAVEQYIDPESLVALWPIRMPVAGAAVVNTQAAPGVPLGSAHRKHHAKVAKTVAAAPVEEPAAAE